MTEILELINTMSPFVLLGFLLAGIMHAFVPGNLYSRYLGGGTFRSVINATILGVPLPLCSCGVIPTAMSLHKEGASKAATVSFLIATPQTGIDSIIATYSLMGLPFALLRPLAAIITALTGGLLTAKFSDEKAAKSTITVARQENKEGKSFGAKIMAALKYAFVDMMQDIGKWLMVGLIVAGLITVFVPESFFEIFADNSLLSMLLVLLLAIPMYLCATGSIPIAVALMLKGLTPGTAFVLLMAGPAVNTASMLIIGKVMGRRTLFLYLLSIIAGAITFGLIIDNLLPREWFSTTIAGAHAHEHGGFSYFDTACSVLLAILLINAFIQRHRHKHHHCHCEECSCNVHEEQTVFAVDGMACNHCKASVEKAIAAIEGVSSVDVNLADGKATVKGTFDKSKVIDAVTAIGFSIKEEV